MALRAALAEFGLTNAMRITKTLREQLEAQLGTDTKGLANLWCVWL